MIAKRVRPWACAGGLLLAPLILYFVVVGMREFAAAPSFRRLKQDREEMAGWPAIPGRLVKLRVGAWSLARQSDNFTARGEYLYEVGGKPYRGNRLSVDGSPYESSYWPEFRSKVASLAPGLQIQRPPSHDGIDYVLDQPVTVHYDPADPGRSVLNNKDARPLSWGLEVGLPLLLAGTFVALAIRLALSSLRGLGESAGFLRPGPPGLLRSGPDGTRVYGGRPRWLWLVNIAGLLFLAAGWGMSLETFRPIPGESLGCFSAVFVGFFAAVFALCGGLATLLPQVEVVVDGPGRSVRRVYRNALIPFPGFASKRIPLDRFDHVRLEIRKKGWSLSLVGREGVKSLPVLDDATELAGPGDPADGLSLARDLAAATGLRPDCVREAAPSKPSP